MIKFEFLSFRIPSETKSKVTKIIKRQKKSLQEIGIKLFENYIKDKGR